MSDIDNPREFHGSIYDAWSVLLSILLGLTLTIALKTFFLKIIEIWNWEQFVIDLSLTGVLHLIVDAQPETYLRWAQLAVFIFMMARFYGGAFRFHEVCERLGEDKDEKGQIAGTLINLIGTFALFTGFFVAALSIWHTGKFFFVVWIIHLIDLCWFVAVCLYLKFILNCPNKSAQLTPVWWFMIFTLITLIVMPLPILFESVQSYFADEFSYRWVIICFLVGVSIIDLIILRNFYFRPNEWVRSFTAQVRRVYLAGPDVFTSTPENLGDDKKAVCVSNGLIGCFPLDNAVEKCDDLKEWGYKISEANERLMRSCDFTIANMTPFRGPSLDVGTAYEMGFMRGLGKPVFAYSNKSTLYFDRVKQLNGGKLTERDDGNFEDKDGMLVENFDLHDNLMLDGAVHSSGGEIVTKNVEDEEIFSNIEAFKDCVKGVSKNM